MTLGRLGDLAAMFITLGTITVILTAPNTVALVTAVGRTFGDNLRTAMGR